MRISDWSSDVCSSDLYQWDSNTAYHFAMITPAGSGLGPFGSMVGSLDRLSASEAAAIRPRVIDVVTVKASDTVQSLAGRMAYDDYKLERLDRKSVVLGKSVSVRVDLGGRRIIKKKKNKKKIE